MAVVILNLQLSGSGLVKRDPLNEESWLSSPLIISSHHFRFLAFRKGAIIDQEFKTNHRKGDFCSKQGRGKTGEEQWHLPEGLGHARPTGKYIMSFYKSSQDLEGVEEVRQVAGGEGLWVVGKTARWDINPQRWAGVRSGGTLDATLRAWLDEICCS